MTNRISFVNGEFINHDQAFVHIEDRGFQFADSVYEVVLYNNQRLIDKKAHLDRLFYSLNQLNIQHNFLQNDISKIMHELFVKNNMPEGSVYIQISRGVANRLPNCPKDIKPTIVATVSLSKKFLQEEFAKGLSLMSHEDIRWQRCNIKSVALIASSLANQKAKDLGFDDALFVRQNVVTEGSFSNFFFVDQENNLITKNADNFILQGITRNRIIELAKNNNIKVIEKNFGLDEVFKAKEAFLTSSTLMIRPVTKIDNKPIFDAKVGVITSKLSNLYKEFVKNYVEDNV